jgi:dUTP pyrophosphatase
MDLTTVCFSLWIAIFGFMLVHFFRAYASRMVVTADHARFIPRTSRKGDAAYDLTSAESGRIAPRSHALIYVGCRVKIPKGYMGQIWPRSGLAVKDGIDRRAGAIDSNYRGPLKVCLFNDSDREWKYDVGDRIAQLCIVPVATEEPIIVSQHQFDDETTTRGAQGFGSSGQ